MTEVTYDSQTSNSVKEDVQKNLSEINGIESVTADVIGSFEIVRYEWCNDNLDESNRKGIYNIVKKNSGNLKEISDFIKEEGKYVIRVEYSK